MAYGDDATRRPLSHWLQWGLGLTVIGAIALGVTAYRNRPDFAATADVQQAIKDDERIAPLVAEVARRFPADYKQLWSERLIVLDKSNFKASLQNETAGFFNALLRAHNADILGAPDAALAAIAAARATHIIHLEVDSPEACASYARFAISPFWEKSSEQKQHAAAVDVALLRAADAGSRGRIDRSRSLGVEAANAAFSASETALGMTPKQIEMQSRTSIIGLRDSPKARCRAGVLYYQAIARLPAPLAAALVAQDLRTSPILGGPDQH
jgi:hypothetical protein